MEILKSNCEKVVLDCNMTYDEFMEYYNNCICMDMLNDDNSITVNNLKYLVKDGNVELEGYFFEDDTDTYIESPNIIVTIILPSFVSSIADAAFIECQNLTEISGDGITDIGSYAFNNCVRLEKVNFPNLKSVGDNAFQLCRLLKEINLLNCIKVGNWSFDACNSLKEIKAPNLIRSGISSFSECYSLTDCKLDSIDYLPKDTFTNCLNLQKFYAPKIILGLPNTSEQKSTPDDVFNGCCPSLSQIHVGAYIGNFHAHYFNCELICENYIKEVTND